MRKTIIASLFVLLFFVSCNNKKGRDSGDGGSEWRPTVTIEKVRDIKRPFQKSDFAGTYTKIDGTIMYVYELHADGSVCEKYYANTFSRDYELFWFGCGTWRFKGDSIEMTAMDQLHRDKYLDDEPSISSTAIMDLIRDYEFNPN